MQKLTFETVRKALKARGVTIRANEWGEYRINYTNGREETAAYVSRSHDRTETLQEALDTGLAMADWQDKQARVPSHAARLEALKPAEKKRYRLGSSELVSAPGIVAWAINGYAFKRDRKNIETVISEGWRVPVEHARQLLSKAVPYTLDGETVVFEVAA